MRTFVIVKRWHFMLLAGEWMRIRRIGLCISLCQCQLVRVCHYQHHCSSISIGCLWKWAWVFWQARLSLVVVKIRILSVCSTWRDTRMRKWSQCTAISSQHLLIEVERGPGAAILTSPDIRWLPARITAETRRRDSWLMMSVSQIPIIFPLYYHVVCGVQLSWYQNPSCRPQYQ